MSATVTRKSSTRPVATRSAGVRTRKSTASGRPCAEGFRTLAAATACAARVGGRVSEVSDRPAMATGPAYIVRYVATV